MSPILNTGDGRIRLTKICLGMPRKMVQRHVHFSLTLPGSKVILITKALKDPLGSMPLLLQALGVVLKNLIDNTDKRIKLGPVRRLLAATPRRGRERQHLINRAPVNAKQPCGFAAAHTLNLYRIAYATIQFHLLHPRPLQKQKVYHWWIIAPAFSHAVDAAKVAAIGHGNPEIGNRSPEWVNHGCFRMRRDLCRVRRMNSWRCLGSVEMGHCFVVPFWVMDNGRCAIIGPLHGE